MCQKHQDNREKNCPEVNGHIGNSSCGDRSKIDGVWIFIKARQMTHICSFSGFVDAEWRNYARFESERSMQMHLRKNNGRKEKANRELNINKQLTMEDENILLLNTINFQDERKKFTPNGFSMHENPSIVTFHSIIARFMCRGEFSEKGSRT